MFRADTDNLTTNPHHITASSRARDAKMSTCLAVAIVTTASGSKYGAAYDRPKTIGFQCKPSQLDLAADTEK